MVINPILYQDSVNKYYDIQRDYNSIKSRVAPEAALVSK